MKRFEEFSREESLGVKYVLHDIDDTITDEGKLLPAAYEALWKLHYAGIKVIPVTGRPAGWCDMIMRQWPVDAVIGENGALVYYMEDMQVKRFLHPSIPTGDVKARLEEVTQACLNGVPGCRVSKDQFSRLYDVAIDFCEDPPRLPLSDAEKIWSIAISMGAEAKISSIHVNFWFGNYDKRSMALLFFEKIWEQNDLLKSGLFFGDSPNDEPMFEVFPKSCGVANISPFLSQIKNKPTFITDLPGGRGFAEAVDYLLKMRQSN